jgi:hypothetical protein
MVFFSCGLMCEAHKTARESVGTPRFREADLRKLNISKPVSGCFGGKTFPNLHFFCKGPDSVSEKNSIAVNRLPPTDCAQAL